MISTNSTLLRLHVEAVWRVRLPALLSNEVELLPESLRPTWKLCAAELADGRIHIWRPDVQVRQREALRLRVDEALTGTPQAGGNLEVALSLVASPRLDLDMARTIARPLTEHDRSLIKTFQTDLHSDYFHPTQHPLIGVVIARKILSLAHSSRRTTEACELGIDTLHAARRKGYALAATMLWADAVMQEGLVPLYSADASNTASLRLAAAAGYRPFAQVAIFEE